MSGASQGATSGATSANQYYLNALQNLVVAINTQSQNDLAIAGNQDFFNLTAATVVKASAGRIVRVSVIVAGSATGMVYDASSLTDTSKPLYVIPMTVGVVEVSIPTAYGIVVSPGSGQTVSGSFS